MNPNDEQRELIRNLDGIYCVDAGAGTGKTFTITRRYAHILGERDVDPEDILLITFTESAADNMKERIISHCGYDMAALRDAPISTFHGHCNRLLSRHGFDVPSFLGVDEHITSSTTVIENEILEEQEFERFFEGFMEDNPQYGEFYQILWDETQLLSLIKSLCAKGIFPAAEGWYRDGESYLDGDFDAFRRLFDRKNEPGEGKRGPTNSYLKNRLRGFHKKCFTEDAPSREEVRGGGKQVPERFATEAFYEDRGKLKRFLHDVYQGYVEYALGRNYMNFSFMLMFAYVLLIEDDEVREAESFEYVMVDEFQDTNEIQFKLTLLLSGTGNIAVVGDWKQSIYGFQYAAVENIRAFDDRLERFMTELNRDRRRLRYEPVSEAIHLKTNYRSSQAILDFSEESLVLEATKYDSPDRSLLEKVTSLEAAADTENTDIEAFVSAEEQEALLTRIREIVADEAYMIEDDGEERTLSYGDVAVLVRTKDFGLELQRLAREHGIPAAYEGEVRLFNTDPGKLVLAWLRVLHWKHSDRGWAVILEEAGYRLDEVEAILEGERYPAEMLRFRRRLDGEDDIGAVARLVCDRYGMDNGLTDRLIDVLRSVHASSYLGLGGLIRFVEENIERKQSYTVDNSMAQDVVTIQTIHKAKGLEYPAVFVADINDGRFPSRGSTSAPVRYDDPLGLRQTKLYREGEYTYVYDNWRSYILNRCLSGEYDEEKRLMYVAMTRAENYLFFSAEDDRASRFFTSLPLEPEELEAGLERVDREEETVPRFGRGETGSRANLKLSAHSLLDMEGLELEGKGTAYGERVHRFAEHLVRDRDIAEPEDPDEAVDREHVRQFLADRDGELFPEETVLLPLELEDRRVVLEGVVDLLHVTADAVEIIDYKTDRTRRAVQEYRKQLSVYYHVLDAVYPGKTIRPLLFFTGEGECEEIEPLSREELVALVER